MTVTLTAAATAIRRAAAIPLESASKRLEMIEDQDETDTDLSAKPKENGLVADGFCYRNVWKIIRNFF